MLFFKKKPEPLPKIPAASAQEVAAKSKPGPQAQALMQPGQTPPEYLQTLEDNKQSADAVNFLAHGMPERESVWWACQSSRKVEGKLNGPDQQALSAAEAWVKNPTTDTKAAAAAAAAKTDFRGPGAWAAQGAAWSTPPAAPNVPAAPAIPAAPNAPAAPALPPAAGATTGAAVAGSVMLAAGLQDRPPMPEPPPKPDFSQLTSVPVQAEPLPAPEIPPPDQNKLSKSLKPFIELGKDVASGRNTWA